jgi:hypothetical protein
MSKTDEEVMESKDEFEFLSRPYLWRCPHVLCDVRNENLIATGFINLPMHGVITTGPDKQVSPVVYEATPGSEYHTYVVHLPELISNPLWEAIKGIKRQRFEYATLADLIAAGWTLDWRHCLNPYYRTDDDNE